MIQTATTLSIEKHTLKAQPSYLIAW